MGDKIYNWHRYWYPRGTEVRNDHKGFLLDPTLVPGYLGNPSIVSFETIAATPCLVLLGEPGMGKSHAMRAEYEAFERTISQSEGAALWVDLGAYSNETRLFEDIFNSTEYVNWQSGRVSSLHMFLDSLDECRLRSGNLPVFLAKEFSKYPRRNLHLRIACRSGDWLPSFEQKLGELWGEDRIGIYELAHLTRADIALAAADHALDPNKFIEEIVQRDVVPFAVRPITLKFLLNIFKNGRLPQNRSELYDEGCRQLCEDTENWRAAGLVGKYSADERMCIAGRIAALILLSNRDAVMVGADQGDVSSEDISVRDLAGGNEVCRGSQIDVNEGAIRETLTRTALFSGANHVRFAHQSYAEYLAAWYLAQRETPLKQAISLLTNPVDPEHHIAPQVREVAVWLASRRSDVYCSIAQIDPQVLILTEDSSDANKEMLVDELLKRYDEETSLDHDWDLRRSYKRINHPHLAEQLKPCITSKTKSDTVRRFVIEVCMACELKSLQDDIAEVVLDDTEDIALRSCAARAIAQIGDATVKPKLRQLALEPIAEDKDDELKGSSLSAVWPDYISVEELFKNLTPPHQSSFYGSYRSFLSHGLVQNTKPDDVVVALKWAQRMAVAVIGDRTGHPFNYLSNDILVRAWDMLDYPAVFVAFVDAFAEWIKHPTNFALPLMASPQSSINFTAHGRESQRRRVIQALILRTSSQADEWWLEHWLPMLSTVQDVDWLLEWIRNETNSKVQGKIASLFLPMLHMGALDPQQTSAIYKVQEVCPALAEVVGIYFRPVLLDSPWVKQTRQIKQQTEDRAHLLDARKREIDKVLNDCETDSSHWWYINRLLGMTLSGNNYEHDASMRTDLTKLGIWYELEPDRQGRIIKAAHRYLLEQSPMDIANLSSYYDDFAFAGYIALHLLARVAPAIIETFAECLWQKWVPLIIANPFCSYSINDIQEHNQLIDLAYRHAPKELVVALLKQIDVDNESRGDVRAIRYLSNCWDENLIRALLGKLDDQTLKVTARSDLLSHLLDHRVDAAKQYACTLLVQADLGDDSQRQQALTIAVALAIHADDAGWQCVWPLINGHEKFGRDLVQRIANSPESRDICTRMKEEQIADLFIWLAQRYPPSDDIETEFDGELHIVTTRKQIQRFRNTVLASLQSYGSVDACKQIQRVMTLLPSIKEQLKWALAAAKEVMRGRTWSWFAPEPQEVMKLLMNKQARTVRCGEELLELVLDSLKRLQYKLQSQETPMAQFLWDNTGASWRPKNEQALSDYVKDHLANDIRQVVVNREVEVRRSAQANQGRGEQTDIHVDALDLDLTGVAKIQFTVVIEVKGCWARDLDTAMEEQLIGEYLKDGHERHGIYLVGWFHCDAWNKDDFMKRVQVKYRDMSAEDAQSYFNMQVVNLSSADRLIRAFVLNAAFPS